MQMKTALVLGAGGFIGSHMVKRLKYEGYWVRGVDLKYPEFSTSPADEFIIGDLRNRDFVSVVMFAPSQSEMQKAGFDEVCQFAADMGGAGYVFTGEHDAEIMHNSAQINLNVLDCAKELGIGKIFYSSSACMYPKEHQESPGKYECYSGPLSKYYSLKEDDAYPANPDSEYGWEKLFSERLYLAYARNYGLNVRIARFHNIYGPEGTYKGGKEKAPAAMCRKVVESKPVNTDNFYCEIEVWGDGEQTRSFLYIDDCIDAVRLLMQSDFKDPINIGSEEMVTINHLAYLAIRNENREIKIKHIDGPTGVRGRNSNNDLIRKVLGWEPKVSLSEGMEKTFNWIKSMYERNV
jgi:GDP-D-mannose 3',5'-epimerase